MGYFAVPKLNADIPELCRTAIANIDLFKDIGCCPTYAYLIGFIISNVEGILDKAEERKMVNGLQPHKPFFHLYTPSVFERIDYIRDCLELFAENDYEGLYVIHTILGQLSLLTLQLK